jgi:hypothetical protein
MKADKMVLLRVESRVHSKAAKKAGLSAVEMAEKMGKVMEYKKVA